MPYVITMDDALMRIRLFDTLTDKDLRRMTGDVLELEAVLDPTPLRVTDMTGVRIFRIGFRDMLAVAECRAAAPPRQPIKSALVVTSHVQYGFARMFQTLNDHPLVTVEIFHDMSDALRWVEFARS